MEIKNVHYVCHIMLVQRFEPQGMRFTNFHYYYYTVVGRPSLRWHLTLGVCKLPVYRTSSHLDHICLCVNTHQLFRYLSRTYTFPNKHAGSDRKRFGYGKLWPLRPACSQNQAGSYTTSVWKVTGLVSQTIYHQLQTTNYMVSPSK